MPGCGSAGVLRQNRRQHLQDRLKAGCGRNRPCLTSPRATHEEQFSGLWDTCAQHEIDHLDGKLFIDYLSPLKRQLITRKMEKLKRDRARP